MGSAERARAGGEKRLPDRRGAVRKIAFLVRTLSDRATSRLTLALATEMGARGDDVTVVSLSRAQGAPETVANARLVNLNVGKRITPLTVRGVRGWILQWRPEVMFCQGPGPGRAAVLGRSLTRKDLDVVVVDHNPPTTPFSRLNVVLRRADVLAAPSPSAAKRFSERTGVRDVAVLPDPVLPGETGYRREPPHRWYSESPPVICSVANIIPRKGQDTLIRALASLEARLILVGRIDDLGYLARLQDLAGQLGVLERVSFVGHQANPLPFMFHSDAFALGSRSESFGMVLAEAMACGTPVVAADCPDGPNYVLDQGRAGLLVPVDDATAMATELRRVLEHQATRERLIEAGRRKAASLSVERVADSYLDATDRAADQRHTRTTGKDVPILSRGAPRHAAGRSAVSDKPGRTIESPRPVDQT